MRGWTATALTMLCLVGTFSTLESAALRGDRSASPAELRGIEEGAAGGLRVFWWNIHAGQADERRKTSDFSDNISKLIQAPKLAPDILSFAEYYDGALEPAVLARLRKRYRYSIWQPYDHVTGHGLGIAVYSRFPIKMSSLDFLQVRDRSDSRPEMILTVHAQGKELLLVPIHILDAWKSYRARHGGFLTGAQILAGNDNPVADQIHQFIDNLKARLGSRYQRADTIIVGDFNQPTSLLGIPTAGYRLLQSGWKDAIESAAPTFPARKAAEARSYPEMAIDHAFVSQGVRVSTGVVLPLLGSDHYPLYVVIDPQSLGRQPATLAETE